jgi:uncharacterized membrane protein
LVIDLTMPRPADRFAAAALLLLAAACQPSQDAREGAAPAILAETSAAPFAGIGDTETIRFTGTEPFWSGEVANGRLTYATPENQAGETVPVRRFAGNNGLGFSGILGDRPLDMTITPGACSDGMSDRTYPYTATLQLGEEQRRGCAWTEREPPSGPSKP